MSTANAPSPRSRSLTIPAALAIALALVVGCSEVGVPGAPGVIGPSGATATSARPAAASFVVGQLAIDPGQGPIVPGDRVTIVATVENVGALAGTYDADLRVDGVSLDRRSVEIGAGGSEVIEFQVPAGEPGDYTVGLGDARLDLTVLGPAALEIGSIVADPNPAETGSSVTVTVSVDNRGGLEGTQAVKLRLDGKVVGTEPATVAGGTSAPVTFSIKAPKAGKHTLAVGDTKATLVVWKITRPANGKVLTNKIRGGRGQLTVENGNDRDAVIVLAKSSAPKKGLLVVYVRGGKSATVKGIKDGTYVVFFSLGKRWDSASRAFTSDVERSRFADAIRFRTTRSGLIITSSAWTLTLQPVVGGNAPTEDVGEGDFPGLP